MSANSEFSWFRCCAATRELQLRLGVLHLAVRDPVIAETRRLAARVKRGLGAPQLDQRSVDSRRLRSGSAFQQVLESRDDGRQADAGSQGIGRVSRCRLTVVALVDRGRALEPFDHPQKIIGKLPGLGNDWSDPGASLHRCGRRRAFDYRGGEGHPYGGRNEWTQDVGERAANESGRSDGMSCKHGDLRLVVGTHLEKRRQPQLPSAQELYRVAIRAHCEPRHGARPPR